MNIAVIGAGNMGGALAKGWAKSMDMQQNRIVVTARSCAKLEKISKECPALVTSLDNKSAVADADIVVVAVKPWHVDGLLESLQGCLSGKLVVSVAANVRNKDIQVYAMPNIAAEFGESMTFILDNGSRADVERVATLFGLVGKVMVTDEKSMAVGNMMAGCGIAYVMRFIRAMMEGGVEMGLYPHVAQDVAQQTMQGAITLLQESGLHPEAAIDKVTTPGGLTIRGLNELDHAGFNSAVVRCLKAGLK